MNYTILQYFQMIKKLELLRTVFKEETSLGKACTAAYNKLDAYYTQGRDHNRVVVATICNPRFNFNVFHILWPESTNNARQKRIEV